MRVMISSLSAELAVCYSGFTGSSVIHTVDRLGFLAAGSMILAISGGIVPVIRVADTPPIISEPRDSGSTTPERIWEEHPDKPISHCSLPR
jgi:hypothetical protein